MTGLTDDPHPASAELSNHSAAELSRQLASGALSSAELVEQLVARIEAVDGAGPGLRSVLELAPDALEVARQRDDERAAGQARGALHGVPVLVKDNIDTVAPLHTTVGSLVFGPSSPGADATIITALRQAGAIVLGKANLSEWANFRSRPSSSGWSAAGGQTRNPHALDRTPGGSSAGSGAALAARLTPLAIGTETDGSILCPAASCGVIGLKPTVGLVSRTGIAPISASQDTAGPMGRTVEDVALLLEVLSRAVDDGEDDAARSARRPDGYEPYFASLLGDGGLSGVRIGVLRGGGFSGYHAGTDRAFSSAVEAFGATGATVVDPIRPPAALLYSGEDEHTVLVTEFKAGAAAYFARRGAGPKSLDDVISHARSEPAERTDLFGLELLEQSVVAGDLSSERYLEAREANWRRSRGEGIDRLLAENEVDLVALPTMSPPWIVDHVLGDVFLGEGWSPAAVAGYPSCTMPIGSTGGLPIGLTLWGPPWSEPLMLRVLHGLERVLPAEVTRPMPRYLERSNERA